MKINARMLRSLLKRTLQYFLFILVPLTIFFAGFLMYVNAGFYREARSISDSQRAQAQNACEMVLGEVRRLAAKLSLESNTKLFMTPQYQYVNGVNEVEKLKSYTMIYRYISAMYIHSENNGMVISNNGVERINALADNQWRGFQNGDTAGISVHSYVRKGIYPYFLTFTKPVVVEQQNARGAVVINVDLGEISDMINGSQPQNSTSFYMLDADRRILAGPGLKHVYGQTIEAVLGLRLDASTAFPYSIIEGGTAISIDQSEQLPLYFVSVLPLDRFSGTPQDSVVMMVFICLASFVASFATSFVITYKSILSMRKAVMSVTNPVKGNQLERDLRYMLEDLVHKDSTDGIPDAFASRLYLLQKEQAASLQAQISPHFLYNTLDTISWMAYADLEGKNRVSDSLSALSDLLRYILHQSNFICSVAEELSHVRAYINLIKLRYSSRFQVSVTLDAQYHDNVALRFLLQPLIENAVTHGVKPCADRLVDIVISGYVDGDALILEVSDNGVGITAERLEKVNASFDLELERMEEVLRNVLADTRQSEEHPFLTDTLRSFAEPSTDSHGLGLCNVNTRIRLIFGERYGLHLRANDAGGVTTVVRLPRADTK